MKLIKIITFAALALTAEAQFRGHVGKNDARRELKAAKAKAKKIGGECQSCDNQLPGYALFGKNYEDKDFYENLVETILEAIFDPSYSSDAVGGEDYFVPGPFGVSTDGETCYDDAESLIICGLVTFIGEAIYRSELLSCLYTQILTFARGETCNFWLHGGNIVPNRRSLSDRQKEAVDRVLQSELTDPLQRDTMAAMAMMGAESLLDMTKVLGMNCGDTDNPFIAMICNGDIEKRRKLSRSEKRELLPSVDDIPIAEGVVGFLEGLDEFGADPDVAMTIQDNLFFEKCTGNADTGLCAALFGLLKTFDAIICRFRDERECGSETCTKDLAFDTNFQAERLAIDLPTIDGFDISRFLAPCDYCLAGRSGGCAGFCPYYESHQQCPFSAGPSIVSGWIEDGLPGNWSSIGIHVSTPTPPW